MNVNSNDFDEKSSETGSVLSIYDYDGIKEKQPNAEKGNPYKQTNEKVENDENNENEKNVFPEKNEETQNTSTETYHYDGSQTLLTQAFNVLPQTHEEKPMELEKGIEVIDDVKMPNLTEQSQNTNNEIVDMCPSFAKPINIDDLPLLETDPEIERKCVEQIKYFKKKGKFKDFVERKEDFMNELLQYIQRTKVNCIQQCKYKDAQSYEILYKDITNYLKKIHTNGSKQQQIEKMESKIKTIEQELKEAQQNIEKDIKREQKMKEEKIEKLEEQQEKELIQMEEKWNDTSYLRKYEKPSSKLLQLSTIERSLVQNGNYIEAEMIKREIEKLEIEESKEAQRKAYDEMLIEQKKTFAKHEKEKTRLTDNIDSNINRRKAVKESDLAIIQSRLTRNMKNLNDLKDSSKKLPPLENPQRANTIVLSPRTQQRMMLCKKVVRSPHITIKPLGKLSSMTQKRKAKALSSLNSQVYQK